MEVNEGVLTYLEENYVEETYRGQGIATRALEKVWDVLPELEVRISLPSSGLTFKS